ncbi:hypothetical protein [Beijerinckia mobilis]|uniref:hypothetical protein n=1 Tax=Beijerinckia mobilis TaxID=231434 RepID=UPI0005540FFB|nr:hypothetical protein [Beijerinckia mobilis]
MGDNQTAGVSHSSAYSAAIGMFRAGLASQCQVAAGSDSRALCLEENALTPGFGAKRDIDMIVFAIMTEVVSRFSRIMINRDPQDLIEVIEVETWSRSAI